MFVSPVEDYAILLFVAGINKNMPATPPAPPGMEKSLCRPGGGRREKVHAVSQQAEDEKSGDDAF